MLPIIDTHQHLWDLTKFDLPWLAGAPKINQSHVTRDYLAATEGLNVVKAIYMEVDVQPSQQNAEADYIIDLCQRDDTPTVGAVISGRPNEAGFRDYISRFKGSPYIKGVRQVLHVPSAKPGLCLEAQFVDSVRYLGELGMSFDLCMRPAELTDGAKLAELCPDTQLIVDHCGNAHPQIINGTLAPSPDDPMRHEVAVWEKGMKALAAHNNVVCKISGIVARAKPDSWTATDLAKTINFCLDTFGFERVIFGGDWPVCKFAASYKDWATALRSIIASRTEAEQRKLLHNNAERIYKL